MKFVVRHDAKGPSTYARSSCTAASSWGWPTPKEGRLTATARVVRKGWRTLVLECDVTDLAGKLVARASSNFLVLDAGSFAQG